MTTVPQSQGDPKILKRGHNFEQKGDPNDVKGDPKFERVNMLKMFKWIHVLKHSFVFSNKLTYK